METQDGRPVLPGPQEGAVGRPASIIESRESLEGGNPFIRARLQDPRAQDSGSLLLPASQMGGRLWEEREVRVE